MPASRHTESRSLPSEAGSYSYKLVPQEEGRAALNTSPPGLCDPTDIGCSFPFRIAPSSNFESLLGSAEVQPGIAPEPWYTCTAQEFMESTCMQAATVLLIFANAMVIGFETDMPDALPWDVIENVFLLAFTVELVLKLSVFGPTAFFRCKNNPDISWNLFDVCIVGFGIFNLIADILLGGAGVGKDATLFRMIRLLRILRVLRIIRIVRFLKQLYLLAYGFMEGTMAVFWVTLLASFALYICSVILVRTYGRIDKDDDENWQFFVDHFGNIPRTMFNLFELLCDPDMMRYRAIMFEYPPLLVFLVTFVVLGSFGINGLLVALINESILEKNQARLEADRIEREAKRKLMQQRCREVYDSIDVNRNRVLPRNEIMKCKDQIMRLFEESGAIFRSHDLDQMFYIMDYNDTGIIERGEFVQGVVELCDQIRPMSIMELHCQVSKCASKIENCESKMESVAKSIDFIEAKEEERLRQADKLVDRLHETAEKLKSLPMRRDREASAAVTSSAPEINFPVRSRSSRLLGGATLAQLLEGQQLRLAEAQAQVEALLKSGHGAEALGTTAASAEGGDLVGSLFRLQRQTSEVLEKLFAQSRRSESKRPGTGRSALCPEARSLPERLGE